MTTVVGAETSVRKSYFRWVALALIFVIYTIAAADRANIGFALPFIRKEFAMSNTEAGAVLSLFLWGYALMQIPSGFAVSKLGVRRLFSWAMILTSALTGLMGTVSSVFVLKTRPIPLSTVCCCSPRGFCSVSVFPPTWPIRWV